MCCKETILTLRQAHPSTSSPFDKLTLRQAQGDSGGAVSLSLSKTDHPTICFLISLIL